MKRLLVLGMMLMFVITLISCKMIVVQKEGVVESLDDVFFTGIMSTYGALDDEMIQTEFEFSFDIISNTEEDVNLTSIEVVLNEAILDKVISQAYSGPDTLKKFEQITRKGTIILNTEGMTKREILNMGPIIKKIIINDTWTLDKEI